MARLPLFPLPVVLFPGALLPLHVFEPRYRALLTDAIEAEPRFGILPPGPDGGPPAPGTVGCVARIRAVQPLPDGRSNIVVSGEERVALARLVSSPSPYLLGDLEPLPDQPEVLVPGEDQVAAVRHLGEQYAAALAALTDAEPETDWSPDPARLTFQVAALLEWDADRKQHFLAVRSVQERVTRLLHALPVMVREIEGRARVHRRAARNGTGAHS